MTPRVDIFFKIFCAKKFSITQRSFWGHFQKTYISTSVLPNFGQRLPKIQSRDINFCQFYDPPKPGVDRAEYEFSGSKIAKNRLKTQKTPKSDSRFPKSRGKRCPINFCHFYDPPKTGVDRADDDFSGSKIARKCLKTPKNATMRFKVPQKSGKTMSNQFLSLLRPHPNGR